MHYNMPPYATGETGRSGIPKRREIGHGRLAKRSLTPVLPDLEEFGYALRLVSEITESNGSSSMASVCGGSLALMDAGVPIARHVSGVAMGLIMQDERFAVLSDILGDEDHLGDMDFKVAGTENGVTALQMDLKIDSVSESVMQKALAQAREGRFHILEKMREALSAPREEVSQFAPHIMKIRIATDKIRDVIGKGGSVIRNITEMTGASVDIEDDGRVTISGPNHDICSKAKEKIESITVELASRQGLRRQGRIDHRKCRRRRQHFARARRLVAHFANRGRARRARRGLSASRPNRASQVNPIRSGSGALHHAQFGFGRDSALAAVSARSRRPQPRRSR